MRDKEGEFDFNTLIPKLDESAIDWDARDMEVAEARKFQELNADDSAREDRRKRMVSWGLPPKDLEAVSMDNLQQTPAVQHVESNQATILVLSGKPGCGKTTAAAHWLSMPGPSTNYIATLAPKFIPVYRLARVSRYSNDEMSELEFARRLVIDDLGNEFADKKDSFKGLVCGIIDARYCNELPLLITTNLDAAEFKSRYGERTTDRLRECGRFVVCGGESMRGKDAK